MTANTPPSDVSQSRTLLQRLVGSTSSGRKEAVERGSAYLTLTECLELLANERRRLVLDELKDADQWPLPTSSLVEYVACAEYDCTPDELTSTQRNRVYVALVQSHLPAFHDAEVLRYDETSSHVDTGPAYAYLIRMYEAIKGVSPS